jgi:hypothetical protein
MKACAFVVRRRDCRSAPVRIWQSDQHGNAFPDACAMRTNFVNEALPRSGPLLVAPHDVAKARIPTVTVTTFKLACRPRHGVNPVGS